MARRARGPATSAVVRAVQTSLAPQDTSLLVACSGGPDSLALAAAAVSVGRQHGLPVAAVVVDHGLQPGSQQVADRARRQLGELGCADVAVVAVAVDLGLGSGPEAAARQARYAALDTEAAPRAATVLLGHTQDDQAETVLLGLARGSGTRSLAGMAARSGRYLRPLLSLARAATEQACQELGLQPWRDPHNVDEHLSRVRVRQRVLPVLEAELGPGIAEALARTAALARADADLLDALAADALPVTDTLDCAELGRLPDALRTRVLRRWLADRGGGAVTYGHVRDVDQLVVDWHGQRGFDLAGVRVVRRAGRLVCIAAGG
ncbi:MAG TPA: tRNA lysidine(34) synthetase TilS [Propionibacteriaceae bacterium]|nr:tRNA lysidine(34) synthetase TilS [Propionibacteriaceae bacterium]